MGFNATVVVLLDRLHEIGKDPEFGRKLELAILAKASDPDGKHHGYGYDEATGQTQVVEVHHADHYAVVAVGGNCGQVLGHVSGWGEKNWGKGREAIVKALTQQYREKAKEAKNAATS
jgi:hypothetical protein